MRERPIPFGAPMVRATLRDIDPKTQTRRVAKPVRHPDLGNLCTPGALVLEREPQNVIDRACPYGQPGDRLWVREAFRTYHAYDAESMGHMQTRLACSDAEMTDVVPIRYEADGETRNWRSAGAQPGRYRHARFMPRWASRILLEVTEVRVERVQDISEADAIAEGQHNASADSHAAWGFEGVPSSFCDCPVTAYAALWEQINGPGSWGANPWVWVVSFRRID